MSNSIQHRLTKTSKARSHCAQFDMILPAQFGRNLFLGTRRKWPRPRRLPPETETRPRRWQFFSRRDKDETLVRLETVSRQRRRDRDHNPVMSCSHWLAPPPAKDGDKFRSIFSDNLQPIATRGKKARIARYWLINTVATAVPLSAHPSPLVITTKLAAAIFGGGLYGGGVLPAQYYPCGTHTPNLRRIRKCVHPSYQQTFPARFASEGGSYCRFCSQSWLDRTIPNLGRYVRT